MTFYVSKPRELTSLQITFIMLWLTQAKGHVIDPLTILSH